MFKAIGKLFGVLLLWLFEMVQNYGVAIILFALIVKLITLPFQLKSKKSMMRTSRMTPRLKELEKKFGNDRQRYQEEVNKLYKEEGVNPMSGCLWSFLPFPILIALYQAIRFPITVMMGVAEDLLAEGGAIANKLSELGYSLSAYSTSRNAEVYEQIYQSQFISQHFDAFAGLSDKLQNLSYKFLGMDLGLVPNFKFWTWTGDGAELAATMGLFLLPIVSALLSWLSMKISQASSPQTMDQQSSNKTMMLTMPLVSLWICFTMPGIMGIYWIAQSVFAIVQDVILNKIFGRQLDIEDAERIEREKARAAELEAKRKETERLKAAGISTENRNTSKKKKQAAAAQKEAERRAAEARAAKLAKRGETAEETPESQVGDRRYARGRAYVADRYTNPESAEEKTAAAAEESAEYEEIELAVQAELTEQETPQDEEISEDVLAEEDEIAELEEQPETEDAEDAAEEDAAETDEESADEEELAEEFVQEASDEEPDAEPEDENSGEAN